MTIYIAIAFFDEVVGAYSTENKANIALDKFYKNNYSEHQRYESSEIIEVRLDD